MEMNESLSVGISKSKISLMKLIICPYVCKIKNQSQNLDVFSREWHFGYPVILHAKLEDLSPKYV